MFSNASLLSMNLPLLPFTRLRLVHTRTIAPVTGTLDAPQVDIQRLDTDQPDLADLDTFDGAGAHQSAEILGVVSGVLCRSVDGYVVAQHDAERDNSILATS